MPTNNPNALLARLNLQPVNAGACAGPDWLTTPAGDELISTNPTTGQPIASIRQATPAQYDQVVRQAQAGFQQWRQRPAPQRGLCLCQRGTQFLQGLTPEERGQKQPVGLQRTAALHQLRSPGATALLAKLLPDSLPELIQRW